VISRQIDLNDVTTLNEFESNINDIILPEIKENLKANLKSIKKPPKGGEFEWNDDKLNDFVNENALKIIEMANEFIRP
jgi:hypothetical protein